MKKKIKCEVWFQPVLGRKDLEKNSILYNTRIRLLKDQKDSIFSFGTGSSRLLCCWDYNPNIKLQYKNLKSKRKAMKEFDKKYKYPKAIKVAEWFE